MTYIYWWSANLFRTDDAAWTSKNGEYASAYPLQGMAGVKEIEAWILNQYATQGVNNVVVMNWQLDRVEGEADKKATSPSAVRA